jgi:plasmid stability protein
MADVLIRNVPDDIVVRLEAAARQHGRTIEAEALEAIQRGVGQPGRFTVDEARARVVRNLARFPKPLLAISLDDLREGLAGAA